jgi:CO/xanthine dehydrogenase Mo-binding subunit
MIPPIMAPVWNFENASVCVVVEAPTVAELAACEEVVFGVVVLPVVVDLEEAEVEVEEVEEEDLEEELVLEDVELGFADMGVKFTPVYTICRSISVGCPEYVVATNVAMLDAPQPYW